MFARVHAGAAGKLLLTGAVLAGAVALAAWGRNVFVSTFLLTDEADQRKALELDRTMEGLLARVRQKGFLTREVFEGRLGLLEAAAQFRALDHAPPAFHWDVFRESTPANSEEERHCREVIAHVDSMKHVNPQASAVVARLEQELREHLRRGKPCLPEIGTLPRITGGCPPGSSSSGAMVRRLPRPPG
jgi:hypothetical protein